MSRYLNKHYRLIPLLTFLVIAAGLLVIWWQLDRAETQMLDLRTRTTTAQVAFRLESFISARLHLVRQLAHQWQRNEVNTPERFAEIARAIQQEFSTFQAINWIDADGVIRWLVPEESNRPALGRAVQAHPGLGEILDDAVATNQPRASGPLTLFQGGRGFGTYFPVTRAGHVEGFLNGVFRMKPVIQDCLREGVMGDFHLRIDDGGSLLFMEGPAEAFSESPYAHSHPVRVLDRRWTLTLVPTPRTIGLYRTWVDEVFLIVGLLLAGGFALTLRAFLQRQVALRESERRLLTTVDALKLTQFAMDHAAVASFWIQDDGSFFYVNEAACRSLGYTQEELLEKKVFDIDPDFPRGAEWRKHWEGLSQRGGTVTFQTRHQRKDGSTFPVEITASPLSYKGVDYHFSFAHDLTERKRAEEERLNMERALLETQKLESLGVLAGGVAHDFNNLLTAVMGSASLARDMAEPDSPLAGYLEHIEAASQQATDLARQMLAYSGKGRFTLTTFDLRSAVQETEHLLRASIPRHVQLVSEVGDQPLYLRGDPGQIRQVVMNLVINAAEAIGQHEGTVTIRTRSVGLEDRSAVRGADLERTDGDYVLLEVDDTGPGMDAETQARIFEPFFSTKATGRGLGLAAVGGIVRGHHGSISVDTTPGKGTRFGILLPAAEPEAETRSEEATDPAAEGTVDGGTVLVVDDEDAVRTVARIILEENGYNVLTAEDGREGVDLFRQHADEVQVVLLDLTMPHMGGREAMAAMREIRPGVRVLLSSGYDDQEAASELAGNRVTAFIHKPYRAEQLLASVREILAV